MISIILETIPHSKQRYKTVGDWYEIGLTNPTVLVKASELSDWRREALILVHELVEYVLCKNAGITQQQVDEFDKAHEDEQGEVELGDMPEAPYRRQHCFATAVERMLAAELDVVWSDYEEELVGLS